MLKLHSNNSATVFGSMIHRIGSMRHQREVSRPDDVPPRKQRSGGSTSKGMNRSTSDRLIIEKRNKKNIKKIVVKIVEKICKNGENLKYLSYIFNLLGMYPFCCIHIYFPVFSSKKIKIDQKRLSILQKRSKNCLLSF
jgi:hypothetical protein